MDAAGNLIGRWDVGRERRSSSARISTPSPRAANSTARSGCSAACMPSRSCGARASRPHVRSGSSPSWTRRAAVRRRVLRQPRVCGRGRDAAGLTRDAAGMTLAGAMRERGFDGTRAGDAARIRDELAYVELHIEQGPVLEAEGNSIGVVTSIVGQRGYRAGSRARRTTPGRRRWRSGASVRRRGADRARAP